MSETAVVSKPGEAASAAAPTPPTAARPAPRVAKAADLTRHLTKTEVVTVQDIDGSEWVIEVRGVSAAMWDPGSEWYARALATGDKDTLAERLAKAVGEPPEAVLRAILVAGCVQPAVTREPREGAVAVDDLLSRDILARNIYAEVARISLANLASVEKA